jgi:membrane fusion protein (multidrug efflux system)
VAQTQAPDTIEIRSQVTGLLERQAFADGSRVKKGDVLTSSISDPSKPSSPNQSEPRPSQANLVNAQQNLARNSRLIAQKAVSQQDYDTAVAQERASTALVGAQALQRNVELNLGSPPSARRVTAS